VPRGGARGAGAATKAWTVVILLFVFMLINFADKIVLGLAAVPIMRELGLAPAQFGILASSFFLLFSTSAIVIGFGVNHVATRWAMLGMALVWSLAQLPMLGSVGFGVLMACRIVLGAGEGPAFPVALHAIYKWFPNERRVVPTAIVDLGALVGLVVAPPALTYLITRASWHWAFGALGIIGLLWTIAWVALGAEGSLDRPIITAPAVRVPYARLLTNGTALAIFAGGFGAYWGSSLLFSWFTPYLMVALGFSQEQAGWLTSLPPAAAIFTLGASAWVSQAALARGATTRKARGLLGGAAVTIGGLAMVLLPHLDSVAAKIAMIVIGVAVPPVIHILGHPMISEFTPPPQRGAMLAITNAVWTLAGVIAPYMMGHVIEAGGGTAHAYERGFVICGLVALTAGIFGMVFLRPEAETARLRQWQTVTAASGPRPSAR
jgi:MFS transporter, ACS family, D-galactonate transporter